jgi:3-oxoacyl-[acyl-carrier protein] reductase
MQLAGKVAVVTGGTRGIGNAIARQLVERGAAVAITGTNQTTVEAAAEELGAEVESASVMAVQADVRQYDEVQRSFDRVVERFGGVDIVVNNAGVGKFSSVAEMSLDEWRAVIDTNLTGVFHCCRAALPYLRVRGGGWIINVSSLAGKNAFPEASAYCASKSGLNAFSEALMQEVRHDGIRVSYVMPGSVATDFGGRGSEKSDWALRAEDVAEVVVDLLNHPARSLPSRVEIRPSRPPKK